MTETKTKCRVCGATILLRTAEATGGYCRSLGCNGERNKASRTLLDAARTGDTNMARAALAAGASIAIEDGDKYTPLELACAAGHAEIVRLLLSHGVDPNRPHSGRSAWLPLMFASGGVDIVEALLEGGARIDGRYGYLGLSRAASNGDYEIARLLLDRGADLMARDQEPWFFNALFFGHVEIIRLILDRGVDVNVRAYEGGPTMLECAEKEWAHLSESEYSAFHGGFEMKRVPGARETMREFLLSRGARREGGISLASFDPFLAVMEGREDVVARFLQSGFDPNDHDSSPQSLLHTAASSGWPAIVKLLLRAGAQVDLCNAEGRTPLHIATSRGHPEVVSALLGAGANTRAMDTNGNTPVEGALLLIAGSKGREHRIMDILLQYGADPNVTSQSTGFAPLHYAAVTGDAQFARALLDAGAHPDLRDSKLNSTPLHWAVQLGHTQVVQTLVAAGADTNAKAATGTSPIGVALTYKHLQVIETLLIHGADPNTVLDTQLAWRPLHFVTANGPTEVISLLIKYGCDVNAGDTDGVTALHLAAEDGNIAVVRELLAAGANPLVRNRRGIRSVKLAQHHHHVAVERLLAEATRTAIQRRMQAGLCIECGESLGFMDKLSGRQSHKHC